MSVITSKKDGNEIERYLRERGSLHVAVIGCDKCAKLSNTGGAEQVREMKEQLRSSGFMLLNVEGLVDAVEEGLCDPKAVPERLAPLKNHDPYQLLVLACGAGLLCARNTLPGVRIVPGLNTLGPGVKDQLACIACGECKFGEKGCAMARISGEQAKRLGGSYMQS
jgi:hypothetical protein